jgi:hypothetical protein
MVNIAIPDKLAEQLETVARRENRPVAEVIETMLEQYEPKIPPDAGERHPLDAFIGLYDDDITDMSTSVRKTIREHFQRKNDRTD